MSQKPSKREKRRSLLMGLWKAQGKHCAICGVRMLPVHYLHPRRGWSVEHVYPQGRYHYEHSGNRLVSHLECNHAKQERDPTGCEVILLHATNAAIGLELKTRPLILLVEQIKSPNALSLAFQRAMGMKPGPLVTGTLATCTAG